MKEVNISKDEFCKIINKLRDASDRLDEINHALGAVVDVGDLSDTVVELLEKLMGVEPDDFFGSDICYFCWEINFGRAWTPESITEDGRSVDISTAEKLYDYLVS